MLNFDYPWVFALLPLPLLAYWLLPKAKRQQAAVRVPFFNSLSGLEHSHGIAFQQRKWRLAGLALLWLSLVCAGAGPVWWGDPISLPASGRDLLLDVDLSGSMQIRDMQVNGRQVERIAAVKSVLKDFIKRRAGDRIGLILFGTHAYVQAPLTFDRATVAKFLQEAQIGFAGADRTAIGDAIGLSVKRLRERPGDRHVMILLTDGSNNAGEVQPIPAARFAAENHVVIYTIGIGADEMVIPGPFGGAFGARRINPSQDLDESVLRRIAKITGGQYFRARDPKQLQKIYHILDQLEPVQDKERTYRPQKALFFWPLGLALTISLGFALSALSPARLLAAPAARPRANGRATERGSWS